MGKECDWYQRLERGTAVSNFRQKRVKYKKPDETVSSGFFSLIEQVEPFYGKTGAGRL